MIQRLPTLIVLTASMLVAQSAKNTPLEYAQHLKYQSWDGRQCEPQSVKRVHGSLVLSDGEKRAGLAVAVFRESDQSRVCATVTDSQGRFDCGKLSNDDYRLVYGANDSYTYDTPVKVASRESKHIRLFLNPILDDKKFLCPSGLTLEEELIAKTNRKFDGENKTER